MKLYVHQQNKFNLINIQNVLDTHSHENYAQHTPTHACTHIHDMQIVDTYKNTYLFICRVAHQYMVISINMSSRCFHLNYLLPFEFFFILLKKLSALWYYGLHQLTLNAPRDTTQYKELKCQRQILYMAHDNERVRHLWKQKSTGRHISGPLGVMVCTSSPFITQRHCTSFPTSQQNYQGPFY